MKKKTAVLYGISVAVAIVATVCVAVSNANNTPRMSDLAKKNLEILTQTEDGPPTVKLPCRRSNTVCEYLAEDADGNKGWQQMQGHEYAGR
jgi:hypothetical protein